MMGPRPLTERLGLPTDRGPRILVASAHADDAEIGAGGAIGRLVAERPDATITWLVLAAPEPRRAAEARSSAERLLAGAVSVGDEQPGLASVGYAAHEREPLAIR